MTAEPSPTTDTPARRAPRLLDLLALMVGYGLAGLLIRAFWPSSRESPTVAISIALGLLYLWLGLAMGGPLVLFLDRRRGLRVGGPSLYTWAELAWLLIGMYWLGLAVMIVPTRLPITPWLGVFPIVAGLGLRAVAGTGVRSVASTSAWTHRTGVLLLLTWPPAWADLILLSRTLL